jgi:hypothetical protein
MVEQLLDHGPFLNGFYHYTSKFMTCTGRCNYSLCTLISGVPRNFVRGRGSTNSGDRGQRERGSGGSGPLVRGSGDSCNLVFRGGLNPPNHPLGTPLLLMMGVRYARNM